MVRRHAQQSIDKQPIVVAVPTLVAFLARNKRFNPLPLSVRQRPAESRSSPPVAILNHIPRAIGNPLMSTRPRGAGSCKRICLENRPGLPHIQLRADRRLCRFMAACANPKALSGNRLLGFHGFCGNGFGFLLMNGGPDDVGMSSLRRYARPSCTGAYGFRPLESDRLNSCHRFNPGGPTARTPTLPSPACGGG
jgi:hypothetical protein